jgi:G3E family GTPase
LTINIDIISGFLGSGKTTFLKKIIPVTKGKIVLIENEFGDVGVDGDMLHDNIHVREIYSGCICCSLVQDFKKAIEELVLEYSPDHILIEPSGVGSLSDIILVCNKISISPSIEIRINRLITIVDVCAFEDYSENFGSFYLDQIQNAHIILLSHVDKINDCEIEKIISKIRLNNQAAFILKEDWFSYSGEELIEILDSIQKYDLDSKEKYVLMPANKIFNTFSVTCPRIFFDNEMDEISTLLKNNEYGFVLRAKGFLKLKTNKFVYFDYTPHHYHWEYIEGCKKTKIAFIGSNLKNKKIFDWFNVQNGGIE